MYEEDLEAWQQWWDKRTTLYVSEEDYDHLLEQLSGPPQVIESLRQLLQRKSPWKEHNN